MALEKIKLYGFYQCNTITSVVIPDSTKEIGSNTFFACPNLQTVTMGNGVTTIGNHAFTACHQLQSVIFSDNAINFGTRVFYDCPRLTSANYQGFTFPLIGIDQEENAIFSMIKKRDFSVKMNHDLKYAVILAMFQSQPHDEATIAYIKKIFSKVFCYLIDREDIDTITNLINSNLFLTKRNIDKYIEYAIANGYTEIQILLMNHKAEKIGYSDPMSKFKL